MSNKLKGIILAGGHGSRLYPLTRGTSKQLLPVYDKPMIYYPLSVLMNIGVKDVLIISTEKDINRYEDLFEGVNSLGLKISFKIQEKPNGIAEAFIIGKDFIGESNVCLILGDNIFHGDGFINKLETAKNNLVKKGFSTIFGYEVDNPNCFGVAEFDSNQNVISIEEKPIKPKSNFAIVGLYFYTNDIINNVKLIQPSKRGELEISDINNIYIKNDKLQLIKLDKSFSWLDTGTFKSLIYASEYFRKIELKTKSKVACVEEIALKKKLIDIETFEEIARSMINSSYGKYLLKILKEYNGDIKK